jgi:tetratricopeptide (TPR) repeat protein
MGLFDYFKPKDKTKPSIDLTDLKFLSDDHTRIENGRPTSASNKGAWRGIRVKSSDNKFFFVSMYNINEKHPVWGDNIQMAEKRMKLIDENSEKIILRGFGTDAMGSSFAEYGLTLFKANNNVCKVALHMHERNIDIVYEKASQASTSKSEISGKDIEREFFKGVEAINSNNSNSAVIHFKNSLSLMYESGMKNEDWESSCCFNLGEALKDLRKIDEAIIYYKKAIEKKKLNEGAYLSLAECYFLQETKEGLEHVIEIISKCILYFPNNEIAHLNKGVALFKLNKYFESFSSFQKATQLGSQDARVYLEINRKYVE